MLLPPSVRYILITSLKSSSLQHHTTCGVTGFPVLWVSSGTDQVEGIHPADTHTDLPKGQVGETTLVGQPTVTLRLGITGDHILYVKEALQLEAIFHKQRRILSISIKKVSLRGIKFTESKRNKNSSCSDIPKHGAYITLKFYFEYNIFHKAK